MYILDAVGGWGPDEGIMCGEGRCHGSGAVWGVVDSSTNHLCPTSSKIQGNGHIFIGCCLDKSLVELFNYMEVRKMETVGRLHLEKHHKGNPREACRQLCR